MKLKTKLVSLIIGFVMVASMLFFGVWAASSANVTLGGTISFSSTNVYARVTGTITGAKAGTITLPTLEFNSEDPTPAEDAWTQNLEFDDNATQIKIEITIQNLASDRTLYASVTDQYAADTTLTKTITEGANALVLGDTTTDTHTQKVTITLDYTDTDVSFSELNYGYLVHLDNEEPGYTHEFMKYDAENNYYYLEMGTYNNAAVRWRYVSSDGETAFAASKTNTPVTTTGSTGYFILETKTVDKAYDTDSQDYATSDIAAYLAGTDSANSFLTDLNIATDNTIYSKIKTRTMQNDLYKNMGYDIDTSTYMDVTEPSTDAEVKLWLPSVKEAYGMLNNDSTPVVDEMVDALVFGTFGTTFWWLRTPDPYGSTAICGVNADGSLSRGFTTNDASNSVRPMFCLTF